MRYRHYIWDFDGTLADSYPHILRCFCQILSEEGISVDHDMLSRQFYDCFEAARQYSGISSEGYRRFGELHHRMGNREEEPKIVPYPQAERVLRAVVLSGGDNYVYTNRNETARQYCVQFGFDQYIKGYVTSENKFPMKPAPDALCWLMKTERLSPEECVMIGDRELDGLSGVNAGMDGCLVTDVSRDKDGNDPLAVSRMKYKCRSLAALIDLFDLTES